MERTNHLTKRDYNNIFNFTDASKFQIDNDATKTKGKTSSSTIDYNDDYNLNRTVVDDEGIWGWYDNEQREKVKLDNEPKKRTDNDKIV